jgi:hypothetical protein
MLPGSALSAALVPLISNVYIGIAERALEIAVAQAAAVNGTCGPRAPPR